MSTCSQIGETGDSVLNAVTDYPAIDFSRDDSLISMADVTDNFRED